MPTRRSRGERARKSWPSNCTPPASGVSSPAITRSSVVLPEPEGPSSARNSPGRASIETPFSAGKRPNRLATPSTTRLPEGPDQASVAGAARELVGKAPLETGLEDEGDEG